MTNDSKTHEELIEELKPAEGTVVQTGEEEEPSSNPGEHHNDIKAIYQKGRENRELVTRQDEEEMPDAAMVAKMVAEAADDEEFDHGDREGVDLNERKDRFDAEQEEEGDGDPEYVENVDHEAPDKEEPAPTTTPAPAREPEKNLDYEAVDGKVTVKIEGMEYEVPEADIKAAGGKAAYQQNRASNIRFQKAATYGKALQKEREEFAQQQLDSPAKGDLPVEDDLSNEAELVKTYTNRLLDAAIDGTETDVEQVVAEVLSTTKRVPQEPDNSTSVEQPRPSDKVVEDYEASYRLDRANANRMLIDEYSDIMLDNDLKGIAHQRYEALSSDPRNIGRTAVEMAREAGDYVRRLTNTKPPVHTRQAKELEARRDKKRVLPQRSQARTTSKAQETKKPRSSRQYIQDLRKKQGNY